MKNVLQKVKNQINSVSTGVKVKAFSVGSAVGAMMIPISAHAAVDPATGLDASVNTAISSGFTTVGLAITTVVGLGIVATVGVIATSGGAKAGLKWIKGAFAKAS